MFIFSITKYPSKLPAKLNIPNKEVINIQKTSPIEVSINNNEGDKANI